MDKVKIKHWLHGECEYNVKVEEETNCSICIHVKVCAKTHDWGNMSWLCNNYKFGRSDAPAGCEQCSHRFRRWDERQPIPCFKCSHFLTKEMIKEGK